METKLQNKENSGALTIAGAKTIQDMISSKEAKDQFSIALPKHLKPDRFIRVALTAITKTPKLASCTRESLLSCLLDCSAIGLEPDGRKVHLIPYGDKCTLIIDYKGLVDIARRSGEIADIHADVVCENDKFEFNFGSDSKLVHVPAPRDRGDIVSAYSFVRLKDGSSSFEVMNRDEIDKIRARSKAANDGPWKTDWPEMAKKTVFRRHSKWLPVSSELHDVMDKDYDTPADIGTIEQPMIGLKSKNTVKQAAAPIEQAQIVEPIKEPAQVEPAIEQAEPKDDVLPTILTTEGALQASNGETINISGVLQGVKPTTAANKKPIVEYLISDNMGRTSITVKIWGERKDDLKPGQSVVFNNVVVSSFNSKKVFVAGSVSNQFAGAGE